MCNCMIMKNILFTICLISIISSCGETEESKKIPKKSNDNHNDPNTQTEQLDEVFEQNDVKAGGFMADYAATNELRFLDSAFIYFDKSRMQAPLDAFPSIYCGMISEKLGRINDANKFYKETLKIAKRNISNPKPILEYEYGNSNIKELAKNMNLSEDEIMQSLNDTQMFYLLLSKILLKENSQVDLNNFKEIANTSRNFSISQYKTVRTREDILNMIDGN